ncbi:pleckstrin homology domain-containing family H member 1-like isoform X2 [Liolophura sinensis]|uniref:pleckstrin homology domain-containing family H member 1-like isoform X2 n=1 Tax=Liolophura sinensis TaxID=3198878 RepID=UPI003159068F
MTEEAAGDDDVVKENGATAAKTDEPDIDWKSRYETLESSLERFKSQAMKIRQALGQKLKLMEQRLAAMNWEPKEVDRHVLELENSCHEKDKIITDLRQQLEDQKSQRQQDARVVEEKAMRIKDWVSRKLQELEQQNQDLQTENEILQDQLEILRERLQALPSMAAKEIFRASLQECGSRRTSHSSSPPEIPQRPSAAVLNSMRLGVGCEGSDGAGDSHIHLQDSASEDSDDSMEDMEQTETDPVYQEIDRNHESKYEPKRAFPPQIKIERKVFQEAHLLDSLVSSSNGSEEPLNRSHRLSQAQSHTSSTSDRNDEATNTGSPNGGDEEDGDSEETAVSLTLSLNSPRTPLTPLFPQAPPTTPAGSLTEVYNGRDKQHPLSDPTDSNMAFMATLPRSKCSTFKPSPVYIQSQLSSKQPYGQTDNRSYHMEYNSAISEPNLGHQSRSTSKPNTPTSKSSASWENRIQAYTESGKSVKSQQGKNLNDASVPVCEAFSTSHLYRDNTVPVYATLKGKAAQIRSTPFTEDSPSDSSDNEDIPVAMTTNLTAAGGTATTTFTREAVMTVAGPCNTKTTTSTTVRKLPASHSSSGAMKRGVSSSSIGSETSSDYALPPDEASSKSDSENSEPEQKLLKYTTDSAKRDTLERCGYLSKLGGKVKTWKRRWFVLRDQEILYYKSQHDALRKPQGIIQLDSSSRIARSHGEVTFEITNNKRTYYLTADSPSEMEKWIRSVQKALKRQAASFLLDNVGTKTVLKGWLTKAKNGSTRKCFCVLLGRHILYYKTSSDKIPIGQLHLQDARVEEIERTCESDEEFESGSVQRHVLAIWPQCQGPTYLILPTKQEKDSWLYHLTVAAGGGTGNVGTEYEQIISKLMEVDGDAGSVFWKHPMVLHSKEPINRPLTTLPSEELQELAVDLFKSLKEFMCTVIESPTIDFHVTLAQSMLQTCLDHPQLQNELYCQLVKQTCRHPVQQKTSVQNLLLCGKHSWFLCDTTPTSPTSSVMDLSDSKLNPSPYVVLQGWQLLAMCTSLFLPKQSIMWLVRVHLQRNADPRSETGKYAIFCQRGLERTSLKGGREVHPSRMEVLSILLRNPYHHSLPISIPIHFLNGSYQVISFDGSTSVLELLQTLNKAIGMRDCSQSGFALFTDDPLQRDLQHCLKGTLKVCDVISRWDEAYNEGGSGKQDTNRTLRLLYCNRLYFKSTCNGETEKERLLLVYQINNEIVAGRFPLNRDLALELASLMAQIEFGDVRVSEGLSPGAVVPTPQLAQVLDRFYPRQYKDTSSSDLKQLTSTLIERWQALKGRGTQDCVRVYLTVARKWPFCGAKLFCAVPKGGKEKNTCIWLAVHEEGLSVLEYSSMQPMNTYDYKSVITFGGWRDEFMFVLNQLIESAPHHYEHRTDRLLFLMPKPQILEITHLIASYINFRVATSPDSAGDS